MRKNLLKLFSAGLLLGCSLTANAQSPAILGSDMGGIGWPTTFAKAYVNNWGGAAGWQAELEMLAGYQAGRLRIMPVKQVFNNSTEYAWQYEYRNSTSTKPDSIIGFTLDPSTGQPKNLTRVHRFWYNGDKIWVAEVKNFLVGEWKTLEWRSYNYDSTGRLVSGGLFLPSSTPQGIKKADYQYEYNGSGQLIRSIYLSDIGGTEFEPTIRESYTYDAQGRVTRILIEEINDTEWGQVQEINFNHTTTGIAEAPNAGKLQVYPNPFQESIKVVLPEGTRNISAEIYNTLGQKLMSIGQSADLNKGTLDLDLSSLPKGAYILRCVNSNNQVYTQMINKN